MAKILEVKGVEKKYNSLEVLKDIDLDLKAGEIVSLLGPSGSGKTTIFRLITGLTEPDHGLVNLRAGTRVGYVFQEPRLVPWKTVEKNLEFVQNNFIDKKEARLLRDKLLKMSGLDGFRFSYPGQLSGGMKQRLEIIRALAIKPDLLLLDEPFKSLDAHLRVSLRKMLFNYWQQERLSLFMITHDPEEAVLLADRILLLSRRPGRIIRELKVKKPQDKRVLKDEEIYDLLEEIMDIILRESAIEDGV